MPDNFMSLPPDYTPTKPRPPAPQPLGQLDRDSACTSLAWWRAAALALAALGAAAVAWLLFGR